jgi:hypothetical protein
MQWFRRRAIDLRLYHAQWGRWVLAKPLLTDNGEDKNVLPSWV